MICGNCGTQNKAGRRFCSECGNALATACPNCGATNEPSDRFCGNCGIALGTAQPGSATSATPATASTTTERRLVTVLFADLVGFTPFAEDRDPEEVRATLDRYNRIARDVVGRYNGTVEKFIGDAVMAVWGTPTAHEDDAERAVRAALELVDSVQTLGDNIEARAGVLTGEAAVDLSATDQGLLAGDLVNTAARLQQVAPAGSVLVGESTMHAASSAVAFEPAGDQDLKGKSAPIPAWRALRVTAQRGGAGRAEAVETPFVGRDEEFRRLREQLPLSGRDQRVALVSVTGPAGIGKSRLAWELEKYVDGVSEVIYWHRGRCPAYGEGVSFWALGEMVRRRAGLAESDDAATTRQLLHAAVEQYVTDESERDWIEQALLTLLAVDAPAQPASETLFAAWRRFFENVAAKGPTVLVFEDLHWADTGLLDFIDHVLDWSRNLPILIVTLARPELFDRRPNWGAGRRSFTALALDPISDEDMTTMLATIAPDLGAEAVREIVGRADGIPLYAVEFLRMLLADGRLAESDGRYRAVGNLGTLSVPQSLRSLITARLDGLSPEDRRLVQDAAVLGHGFSKAGLAALSGEDDVALEARLKGLVRRELLTVEADPRSPERGQYAFTQSLIREVAYSTLARAERRNRHLAAARYIESVGGEELSAVLAGHYLAAHEASAEGPERDAVSAQARIALQAAAERAASLAGHQQAAVLLQQALSVTTDQAERARLLEQRATALHLAGKYPEARQEIEQALALYGELSDPVGRTRARSSQALTLIMDAHLRDAERELLAGLEELPGDSEPSLRAEILARLARVYYRLGETDRAVEVADEALRIAEHHRLITIIADAMISKGTAMSMSARGFEAMVLLNGGIELARREGQIGDALRGYVNVNGIVFNEISGRRAAAMAREGLALARSIGDMGQVCWQMRDVLIAESWTDTPAAPILADAEEIAALDLAPASRHELDVGLLMLSSVAGRDVEALWAELRELRALSDEPDVDQSFAGIYYYLGKGDFRAMAASAATATERRADFGMMSYATAAAAAGGDIEAARAYQKRARDLPVIGRWDVATRQFGEGLLLVADGSRTEGLGLVREGLRGVRQIEDAVTAALFGLAMARVIGRDEPEVKAALDQSIADMEYKGAVPLVTMLRAALHEEPPPAAARTAALPAMDLEPATSS